MPPDGDYDAMVKSFGGIKKAIDTAGCLHGELLVPLDRQGPAVVSCLWPEAKDYEAWVAQPGRNAPPGRMYEVAISL